MTTSTSAEADQAIADVIPLPTRAFSRPDTGAICSSQISGWVRGRQDEQEITLLRRRRDLQGLKTVARGLFPIRVAVADDNPGCAVRAGSGPARVPGSHSEHGNGLPGQGLPGMHLHL